jgi:hypothetical protein
VISVVPFIRYVATSKAGDARRLYCAVKCAMDLQIDDQELLWEIFVNRCSSCSQVADCWRGGRPPRPRSAEPHFALARELDLIEWRQRWLATLGSGVAYVRLWERGRKPPVYFLLAKLLEYDRAFLIPFLESCLQGIEPREAAETAWCEIWRKYGQEIAGMEPPVPSRPDERTKVYHSATRLSMLKDPPPTGMGLSDRQLESIVREFKPFAWVKTLPDDLYFHLSVAVDGVFPEPLGDDEILTKTREVFPVLKGTGYASVKAAYGFINEIVLPSSALSWNSFLEVLRRSSQIRLRSSFRSDDLLFRSGG